MYTSLTRRLQDYLTNCDETYIVYCDGRYKYGLCLIQMIKTKHSRKEFWCNVFLFFFSDVLLLKKREICCLGQGSLLSLLLLGWIRKCCDTLSGFIIFLNHTRANTSPDLVIKMNAGGVNMDCKANDRDNMFTLMYCLMEIHITTPLKQVTNNKL